VSNPEARAAFEQVGTPLLQTERIIQKIDLIQALEIFSLVANVIFADLHLWATSAFPSGLVEQQMLSYSRNLWIISAF
jgi:hypothetical protein